MTPAGRRKLHSFTRWLRKTLPGRKPINVRLVTIPRRIKTLAWTEERSDGTMRIFIERQQALNAAIYWLEHEWAHQLAGVTGDEQVDHGPHWGHAMSRVEQQFLEWLKANQKKGRKRRKPAVHN